MLAKYAVSLKPYKETRRGVDGMRARTSGFTLLELMITIGVVAILTAIAYPNMRTFMQRNSVIAQANGLQANLQFARGQAAATRSYVSICPLAPASGSTSPTNTTCSTSTGNYQSGWLVYSAKTANSVYSASTSTLQSISPAPNNMTVLANANGVITYNSLGELVVGGNPTNVDFIVCATSVGSTTGSSTTAVPGIHLSAAGSGRIASTTLTSGASCTP
jgi:type IV fimbrial biogenesis protein FimT